MGINCFLSEENLSLHREYLSSLRLKRKMADSRAAQKCIEAEIRSHELYFLSFRKERVRSECIRKGYGSESRFCFLLKEYAEASASDFLYIFLLKHPPFVGFSKDVRFLARAVLAIDLCEHAYFLDYGFDFSAYLLAAIGHLDLSRTDSEGEEKKKE